MACQVSPQGYSARRFPTCAGYAARLSVSPPVCTPHAIKGKEGPGGGDAVVVVVVVVLVVVVVVVLVIVLVLGIVLVMVLEIEILEPPFNNY